MTWEELLTGAIIETGNVISNDVKMSFGDPQLLSGVWWLFKWLLLAIRPFVKWLLIWLLVLLVLYIITLFVFSYLTNRRRKKEKNDISPQHKEFKEIGKQIIVSNMYNYGDIYDPEMEKEIEKEIQEEKEKNKEKIEELKNSLYDNSSTNENKKIIL